MVEDYAKPMRISKYICLWSVLIFSSVDGTCQVDSIDQPDSDFKSYLEEDYLAGARNSLSINTLNIISGYYGLTYERKLTSRWSVKTSASKKLYKGLEFITYPKWEDRSKFIKGYDFSLSAKYNYMDLAITDGLYQNFTYRKRIGNSTRSSWVINSFYTTVGYQHLTRKRTSTGVDFGFGVNEQTATIFRSEQTKTEYEVYMAFEYYLIVFF